MAWDDGDEPRSLALPFNLDLFPVTALVVVAALGVFIGTKMVGKPIGAFAIDHQVFLRMWNDHTTLLREPWRWFGSTLPHGNVLHLFFNLTWVVSFGRRIEGRFGSAAIAGIYLLVALGSSGAEVGLDWYGIGLSGVVYGLFGFLWVMSRYDIQELHGCLDPQAEKLLIGWFLVCWPLTWLNLLPVGNVAHGWGLLQGYLLGMAVVSGGARRNWFTAGSVAAVLLGVLFSTWWFPYCNWSYVWAVYLR